MGRDIVGIKVSRWQSVIFALYIDVLV